MTDKKTESNRLTDLVSWLRISAAGSLDPHVGQAADAIEAQAKQIAELEAIAELNFNGWNNAVEGRMFAQKRIAELEAALKPFANVTPVLQEDDHGVIYEWALNCDDIRAARKVLGEKG